MSTKENSLLKSTYATSRRKTAVSKVWLKNQGTGKITVNGKDISEYFSRLTHRVLINSPFNSLNVKGMYDVNCQVHGSGISSQADAVKYGISKALNLIDEAFRPKLKSLGLLTVDSRRVERKKYGQPKARKKFQFSKR